MECARILGSAGCKVRIAERERALGGVLSRAAVGLGRERIRRLTDWLEEECDRLGVEVSLGEEITAASVSEARATGQRVVLATGSRLFPDRYPNPGGLAVTDPLAEQEVGRLRQRSEQGNQLSARDGASPPQPVPQAATFGQLSHQPETAGFIAFDPVIMDLDERPVAQLAVAVQELEYRPGMPRARDDGS